MKVDEIQSNKFPRLSSSGNRRFDSANKLGHKMDDDQQYNQDNDEEEGENNRTSRTGTRGGGGSSIDLAGRFYGWPSSRIVRVSRASGGKDRHSKVLTSKGLRDRRVRLSVNTAIQFYDLQDRLGCDQPSKAFEWLLKAAASSIAELPPISPFPGTPNRQLSDEKISSTGGGISGNLGVEVEMDMDGGDRSNYSQQAVNGNGNANPSACSSTSETSKGSVLSLSRSESRIKARERAKERVAVKEKKENNNDGNSNVVQVASMANPISQTTSFTELLSTGINNSPNGSVHQNPSSGPSSGGNDSNFFQKSPMDYFTTGHLAAGNSLVSVAASPLFGLAGGDHHHHHHQAEIAHLSFVPDHHLVSVVNAGNSNSNHSTTGSSEYNLNFTISSGNNNNNTTVVPGLAGFNNRGTLQSNLTSPSSLLPRLQLGDGSNHHHHQSFFIAPHVENNHQHQHQHQFLPGYDAPLQLFYGDPHHQAANNHNNNGRHQKGKGKN